jgi:hypothetical protein
LSCLVLTGVYRLEALRQLLRVKTAWAEPEPLEDALAEAYADLGRTGDAIVECKRKRRHV